MPECPAIRLDPTDWYWATWRNLPPLKRPAPPPFDPDEALERFRKIGPTDDGYQWSWARLGLPDGLSREEAHFWLEAIGAAQGQARAEDAIKSLRTKVFAGDLTLVEAQQRVSQAYYCRQPQLMLSLANLFTPEELGDLLLELDGRFQYTLTDLLAGFRRYVLPYATPEELEPLRQRLRATCNPALSATSQMTPDFVLAAVLGVHDSVLALVEQWEPSSYVTAGWYGHGGNFCAHEIIFGLGSPELVETHLRRLRLKPTEPDHARAWLAHTEDRSLGYLVDTIQAAKNKADAEALTRVLGLAESPATVAPMVELVLKSRDPRSARLWLERHPTLAIPALVALAGGRTKGAGVAAEVLRGFWHGKHASTVEVALAAEAPAVAARARTALGLEGETADLSGAASLPGWLTAGLAAAPSAPKTGKLWLAPHDVPPLEVEGHRLAPEQLGAIARALQAGSAEEVHPLITALKAHADPVALDRFAWAFFEYWQRDGLPAKQNWVLRALGLLGGDGCALRLGPLVRLWRENSQHARMAQGLATLQAIGTDSALMQLFTHLKQPRYESLQKGARERLEQIAEARGLTMEQLEDHAISDCGLDARGSRTFDFGPRRFRVVVGPDLKPMVRDADDKLRSDLPKPNTKDDPALANAAVEEWKLLKKLLAEVLKTQAARLEHAMVTERRWPREDWEKLILRHPLMTNLARLVVWAGYDTEGERRALFRVTEDLTCADVDDTPFDPTPLAQVGIIHPLRMAEAERAAWGELFSDYELAPPFLQIGRPVHALRPDELKEREIRRFSAGTLMAASLVNALDRLGWLRGSPGGNALYNEHTRFFYTADLTAVVAYEPGVNMGNPLYSDPQKIEGCFFLRGIHRYLLTYQRKEALPLSEVDPLVISEVLADLTRATVRAS